MLKNKNRGEKKERETAADRRERRAQYQQQAGEKIDYYVHYSRPIDPSKSIYRAQIPPRVLYVDYAA